MIVKTPYLGDLEYESQDIIRFEEGILGFEKLHDYIFVLNSDEALPFHYLQSVEDNELMFIATSPYLFVEDYDFNLSQSVIDELKIEAIEDVTVYCLTVIPAETLKTSINLKAPLVINMKTKLARQVLMDEKFRLKHFIFDKSLNEEVE
ncbi:flagellar assembly protein FliW [Fusibacter sp. 3D3]|uniref:flagellar assembly protein FliW n=1 Tax=Fusibacter sp. 3D3 TaxID=1048380 RepID=UPI000853D937|nr:flagellar assembly protein FliW [Fusibacter sp. 3D3]GAU75666.1 flagellar assembly factor FliW [Fusibacter sp. 3D3]